MKHSISVCLLITNERTTCPTTGTPHSIFKFQFHDSMGTSKSFLAAVIVLWEIDSEECTNKQTNKRIISEMKTDAASTVGHFVCEHVTPRHHRARLMTSSRATFRVNTLRVFAQTSTQRTYASGSLRDPLYHTRRVCTKLLNKSKISVT